jgi:hypothetical protein
MARFLNILLGSLLLSCCSRAGAIQGFGVCTFALAPKEGPTTGHTALTIALAGYIPWEHKSFFCRVGESVTEANVTSRDGATFVTCVTPPGASGKSVIVRMSLDGVHFSASVPTFTYTEEVETNTSPEKASFKCLPY